MIVTSSSAILTVRILPTAKTLASCETCDVKYHKIYEYHFIVTSDKTRRFMSIQGY